MSIEQLNYYRVSCDGLVGRVINHGIIFDSWPGFYALCPDHKES